jgi:hypothetical protein
MVGVSGASRKRVPAPCGHRSKWLALAAVGASETLDRHRQVRKGGDQITFIAARKRPGSEHGYGFRQAVDVPVDWLAVAHAVRETRRVAGYRGAARAGRSYVNRCSN